MTVFTVVTGFFDIGRDKWGDRYQRSKDDYKKHFANMLKLSINMVVFVEKDMEDFVTENRKNIPFDTRVVIKSLRNLEMYKYEDRIREIQRDPTFCFGHPNISAPEICKPLYDVVVNSKVSLLKEATDTVNSDYYIWLDAGMTHGTVDLSTFTWEPKSLLEKKDVISMIQLAPMIPSEIPKVIFLSYQDVIGGAFVGGGKEVIRTLYLRYYNLVREMLDSNIVDDDQFHHTVLYKRFPGMYNLIPGSWYSSLDIK